MRIGISGYVGNKKTGIGRVLENVLMHMARLAEDSEFILFVNGDFDEFLRITWPPNVKVVPFQVSKECPIGNILWHQFCFQQKLKQYKCDCAFIPNFSLLLWRRIPTVAIIHDMIEFNVPNKFSVVRVLYRRFAVPRMARKSDRIVTVSFSSKRDIINICGVPESKVTVAYNGCDVSVFRPLAENDVRNKLCGYALEPGSYILSVGTVDYPGKNVFSLVKAFFRLKEQGKTDKKLVVVGKPGHNAGKIYELVSKSPFQGEVKFLGFMSDEDLPYFYSGAAMFCFLSLYEGFGLPIVEAMACGCPVICSNTSSLPEILAGAGMTVDPLDIEKIAETISLVNNSPDLRSEFRAKGIIRSQEFSWNSAAKVYRDVFEKVKEH